MWCMTPLLHERINLLSVKRVQILAMSTFWRSYDVAGGCCFLGFILDLQRSLGWHVDPDAYCFYSHPWWQTSLEFCKKDLMETPIKIISVSNKGDSSRNLVQYFTILKTCRINAFMFFWIAERQCNGTFYGIEAMNEVLKRTAFCYKMPHHFDRLITVGFYLYSLHLSHAAIQA